MKELLCIVEGYGEVEAAPVLVRRVAAEKFEMHYCDVQTHRRGGISHLRANDWSNFKRYLASAFLEEKPILWMLDCEDDCPKYILPEIREIVESYDLPVPMAIVLWYREYETMFLFDSSACEDWANVEVPIRSTEDLKNIRSAKDVLSGILGKQSKYKETVHQAKLTNRIDIERLEQRYDDFAHFVRALRWVWSADSKSMY